jgi:vancomycin resistance protein YoaR
VVKHMSGKAPADLLKAKRAKEPSEHGSKKTSMHPAKVAAIAMAVVAVFVVLGYAAAAFVAAPPGHVMDGVSVAGTDLGGLDMAQAEDVVRNRSGKYVLTVAGSEKKATIALDGVATIDAKATADAAVALGGGNPVERAVNAVRLLVSGVDLPVTVSLDKQALRSKIEQAFPDITRGADDAHLKTDVRDDGSFTTEVIGEHDGTSVDFTAALRTAESRIRSLSDEPVTLRITKVTPRITAADVHEVEPEVRTALAKAPLALIAKETQSSLTKRQLAGLLDAVTENDRDVRLGLSKQKLEAFLAERTAAQTVAPTDAVFEMKDGKVTKFVPSADGTAIDLDAAADALDAALFGTAVIEKDKPLELPFKVVPPTTSTEAANPYGIKEIIGVGATNFRGSPRNRIHNIGVGAASVFGTLVPAGEEFSMIKTLGTIDGTTGYLQELVIKENKTTPEYGGGLCQIGSTAFRAALDTGLPITERRNHSYRVPYYERDGDGNTIGPGKDATIYDPSPDFRFKNDTGSTLLITTKIEGTKLTFTFWGRKDGRTSAQTDARVYNVVPPPEKTVIQTADLKPGEEKCTEHAHPGSDAMFSYTVTYADGRVAKKDFVSHYKPWGEVCLVGIDPNAPPPANPSAPLPSADAAGATGT